MGKYKYRILFYLCLFTIFGIIFIPNLFIKWSLIDDGYTLFISRSLNENIFSFNLDGIAEIIFEGTGRIRPVYWIYNYIVWLIGGNNPFVHRFFHVVIWFVISLLVFVVVKRVTNKDFVAGLGVITVLLSPLNMENILRLGPQEPLMLVLILLGFWLLLFKKESVYSTVFFILALFTKETSVALLPVLFIIFLLRDKLKIEKEIVFKVVFYNVVFSSLIFVNYLLHSNKGYISNYVIDISYVYRNLIDNLKIIHLYSGSFLIAFLILFLLNYLEIRKISYYSALFFALFITFTLIQAPWEFVLARYLTPAISFLVISFAIELGIFLKLYDKNKVIKPIFVLFLVLFTVIYLFTRILNLYHSSLKSVYETDLYHKSIMLLAKNLSENKRICVNLLESESTMEYVKELELHLSEIYDREDLGVYYLNKGYRDDCVVVDIDVGYKYYEDTVLEDKFKNKTKKEIKINGNIPVFTTVEGLMKGVSEKALAFIFKREKPTLEGIYTIYLYNMKWNIYL